MSRYNFRKPRNYADDTPHDSTTEQRPQSELYSKDFLSSFWPEEDQSIPKPILKRVRKGARSFMEHDNSCQWMSHMQNPAVEPAKNCSGFLTPCKMREDDQPGKYRIRQSESTKQTALHAGDCIQEGESFQGDDKGQQGDDKPQQDSVKQDDNEWKEEQPDLRPVENPGMGTPEWYQRQMSMLEDQQKALIEQQQNLMSMMSNHSETQSIQGELQTNVDETQSVRAEPSMSTNSVPVKQSRSFTDSEDMQRPQVVKLKESKARNRKHQESCSSDVIRSMGEDTSGRHHDSWDHDNHHFWNRQQNNFKHSPCAMSLIDRMDSCSLSDVTQSLASRSDIYNFRNQEGVVIAQPRRTKRRLKGNSAAANAFRMEGSADEIIYYKKKSPTDVAQEETPEPTKIVDSGTHRSLAKIPPPKTTAMNMAEMNLAMGGGGPGGGMPHWHKSNNSPSRTWSRCTSMSSRTCMSTTDGTATATASITSVSRQSTPHLRASPGRCSKASSRAATPSRRGLTPSTTPRLSTDQSPARMSRGSHSNTPEAKPYDVTQVFE